VSGVSVGVIAASPEELRGLERRLEHRRRSRRAGLRFVEGRLGRARIFAVATGEGSASAREGARALLDSAPVELLLVLGFAGGLSPALELGSLLVASRVLDGAGPAPEPDAVESARIARRCGARAATFYTSPRLLGTAGEKQDAWRRLRQDGPAAVDLETAAVGALARSRGTPYVALRAISDTAEESLPVPLERFVDGRGRIRRAALLREALLRPRLLRGLLLLRRRAALCSERLGRAAADLLADDER
jgi:adenosylhomocysteine nucleosidase